MKPIGKKYRQESQVGRQAGRQAIDNKLFSDIQNTKKEALASFQNNECWGLTVVTNPLIHFSF